MAATFRLIRTLRLGMTGPDVAASKTALRAWRRTSIGNTTPVYGDGMVLAVKAFQRAKGIPATGVLGPATFAALAPHFSAAARKAYLSAARPSLVQPVPKPYATRQNAIHETAGLPGYPAIDFFGAPGSPVVAPELATVDRFSGHDPALGPISGPHGPLGWTIYLHGVKSGTDYFVTHLATRTCAVEDVVECGQKIGTVADYDRYGTPSHTHVGVHGGSVSIEKLGAAPLAEPVA